VRSRVGTDAGGTRRAGVKPGAGKKSDAGPPIIVAAGGLISLAVVGVVQRPIAPFPQVRRRWQPRLNSVHFLATRAWSRSRLRRLDGKGSEPRHDCVGVVFDDFRR
jgi:hypothetical protein